MRLLQKQKKAEKSLQFTDTIYNNAQLRNCNILATLFTYNGHTNIKYLIKLTGKRILRTYKFYLCSMLRKIIPKALITFLTQHLIK